MNKTISAEIKTKNYRTLSEWLNEYAKTHQHPVNQKIHKICVPLITLTILGLLHSLPTFEFMNEITWDIVFGIMAFIFYFKLGLKPAVAMAGLTIPMFILNFLIHPTGYLLIFSLIVFIFSWIGQFIGHKIEDQKPAFFQDLLFLLIGPRMYFNLLYMDFFKNKDLKNYMILFRFIFSFVSLLLFSYSFHQLTRWADFSAMQLIIIFTILIGLFISVILVPVLFWSFDRNNLSINQRRFIKFSYLCLGYINFLLFFIFVRDLFSFCIHLLSWNEKIANVFENKNIFLNLYSTDICLILLFLPFLLSLVGFLNIKKGPKLNHVVISNRKIKKPYKIIQISDLHISDHLLKTHILKMIELINNENPEIVCMTGDIIDDTPEHHTEQINQLKKIKSKYGIFFVSGNHEYYWNFDLIKKSILELNWTILENNGVNINDDLQILGVPDPAAKMFRLTPPSVESMHLHLKPERMSILLSHQPKWIDNISDLPIDLQLSGHTHKGQFFPWNFLIIFFQKYASGLYTVNQTQLYVNQGTGYWGVPIRLGTYCEITCFEITPLV